MLYFLRSSPSPSPRSGTASPMQPGGGVKRPLSSVTPPTQAKVNQAAAGQHN